jgi:hypothetical protein
MGEERMRHLITVASVRLVHGVNLWRICDFLWYTWTPVLKHFWDKAKLLKCVCMQ